MIQSQRPELLKPNCKGIRLFLDTANTQQWGHWIPTGLFYGVTTNPLLLQDRVTCGISELKSLANQAIALNAQEVQLQTWGTTVDSLVNTGRLLAEINERVVVKVPITKIGTEAAAKLIAEGIRITLTGVYAIHQVLIAAALGADYVAPYLGRINDLGHNGREDLVVMQRASAGVGSTTRILVASIRGIDDIVFLAAQGLDTFTFSPLVASAFFEVTPTNQAAADFEQAARRLELSS
jgi:transaldolase